MEECVFKVTAEADGGYCAESLTESIFTQADTWEGLTANVDEAVKAFFFDQTPPVRIRLSMIGNNESR